MAQQKKNTVQCDEPPPLFSEAGALAGQLLPTRHVSCQPPPRTRMALQSITIYRECRAMLTGKARCATHDDDDDDEDDDDDDEGRTKTTMMMRQRMR